ncbi:AAA family ATPase [Oscillatoria acuminata]|uniref:Putative ATPase n=1 Tax=Oscillatoria acuminata PCC 6304 TaxID=56110 RepID=K9TIF6_9CYAN|nr:AAA family ATPase [Oscillatoria acuminata]AFY82193.1 putative ATPase [Oscillatoria acuminata PCC 6304]
MLSLAGYEILEEIHESNHTIVCRGRKEGQVQTEILKFLKTEYPTPTEIAKFRHQYEIVKPLDIPGIVKPLHLETWGRGLVLTMEDAGLLSAEQLLFTQTLNLETFFKIAIPVTKSLGEIHKQSIIHLDIKPQNIVVNLDPFRVTLIDFGISTRLERSHQTLSNPNLLEGTLAYMSPEQTGRMNRSIDYRTDFYSLGVTFYQLLTGELPFPTTDPVEMVHAHIAKQPIPPHQVNPEIPNAVSSIVMKLLSKTAEERYQSAYGLSYDLEKCWTQWRETGEIEWFSPGEQDTSDKFQISQKLYGREAEIAALMAAFARVSGTSPSAATPETAGTGIELMLVSGFSGIGKSVIVQEIHKPIAQQRGYFISGKFDQFNRDIPYQSLIQAFQNLIRQILTETPERLARWQQRIIEALGTEGQVLIDVIPELELLIGGQPPVPELPPTETQNRFNLLFQKFIAVFAQKEHTLVLFLDDLQWVDLASLKLIQRLATASESQALLIIGAYRDNEVDAAHPLISAVEEMEEKGAIINRIELQPLNLEHINELIADTVHCDLTKSLPLGQLIYNKTQGNPFFINQLLKSLYDSHLLTFRFPDGESKGEWSWEMDQIQAVEMTDNVVELMTHNIQKLAPTVQESLKIAACIGNSFDLKTLAVVREQSQITVARDLWPAVREGFIFSSKNYSFLPESSEETAAYLQDSDFRIEYKFLHDRVQQAAYSLIPESDKPHTHLRIGQLMLSQTVPEELESKIFDITTHLNAGRDGIVDLEFKLELAQLNTQAGKKAKASTAYQAAVKHLAIARSLLPETAWKSEIAYPLTFKVYRELAECEYLAGNFQEADQLFNILLERVVDNFERAEIYNLIVLLTITQERFYESVQAGLAGMKLMGLEVPETEEELQEAIGTQMQEVQANLTGVNIAELLHRPPMEDPEKQVCMTLLANFWGASFGGGYINYNVWCVLTMTRLSLTFGHAETSAFAYSAYGLMLALQNYYQTGYEFGEVALKLLDKSTTPIFGGKVINLFCNAVNPYRKPFRTNLALYDHSYLICRSVGDIIYGVWALFLKLWIRLEIGDSLPEIAKEADKFLLIIRQTNYQSMVYACLNLQHVIKQFQGVEDEFDEVEGLRLWREGNLISGVNWYYYLKTQFLYTFERYEEALAICREADPLVPANFGFFPQTKHPFYYGLVLAAVYITASETEQEEYWTLLEKQQQQLQIWAENCPENYQDKFLLLSAEMARLSGKELEAMELYRQAIAQAKASGFTQNEALANELAAQFYFRKGWDEVGKVYIREAAYNYQKWGAEAKLQQLETKYPQFLRRGGQSGSSMDSFQTVNSSTGSSRASSLDLFTVMKASEAFSSEIVLSKMLEKLILILQENAGASKAFLILQTEDQLTVEAAVVSGEKRMVLQSIPVEESPDISSAIVNYVAKTQSDVVLNNATREGLFTQDPYILEHQPKSVLCTTIRHQGKLTGILYFENNLTTDAFTSDRLEVLQVLASQAAISLENALLYRTLEQKVEERTAELAQANAEITILNDRLKADNVRMAAELDVTRRLQQMILPKQAELNAISGLEIAGFMEPAEEVGGDYYDVLQYQDRVKIGIGDVTGHGLESGVLMIMAQTVVRSLLEGNFTNPQEFLDVLNRTVYHNARRMNCDKTMTLALLDYADGVLQISGQHEEVLVVRSGGELERIDTIDLGFPIAMVEEMAEFVTTARVELNPGDVVVLYTDGITEAFDMNKREYGLERLIEVVQQNCHKSADDIQQAVIADVKGYIGQQKVYDDITLLVLKQKAGD